MLRNYLLTAWRNLKRQKIFSAINVLGLSIGMAAGMLIVQYVQFELSYDDFHQQASRIYRLTSERYREGKLTSRSAQAAPQIGPLLQAQFPEVRRVALVAPWLGGVVTVSGSDGRPIAFNEKNVLFVDANFLRVFTHPLRSGTASALDQPNAVILTERSARKYFGSQNPLGKTLTFENHNQGHRYTVTVQGVCENGPANSHLPFDFLISRSVPGEAGGPSQWSAYTYVQLSPRGDAGKLAAKLNPFLEKHGKGSEASIERFRWGLQPLSAIHLYSDLSEDTKGNGNGKTIWLLAGVAGLILLIAYVNYINLSTVKSMERAKEVGIRKVLGSGRSHLVRLFFLESLLLNLLAFALALTLVQVSLPAFGRFIGVALSFTLWKSDWLWPGLGCLILGTLLSGLYPALVLSAYQPIQVLKGRMTTRRPGITLRKVLVVLQFTTCVALLIGTLTVYRQVNYMRSKDLGMNMAQTLIVAAPQTRRENLPEENQFNQRVNTFQTEVLRYPGVTGVTHASNVPGLEIDWTPRYFRTQNAPDEEAVYRPTMAIGPEFIDQFGIQLIAGEKFTPRQAQRMGAGGVSPVMLNQAAAQALGFERATAAIGQALYMRNGRGKTFRYEITGVLRNFHQRSLKEQYTPLIFLLSTDASSVTHYAIKIAGRDLPSTISRIEATYQALFPGSPFEFFFLDEFFNRHYQTDQQFGQVFGLFAGFTIFVACLGLSGLAFFTTYQRTKEIGVRKIVGASVPDLLWLLSKDFLKLVVLANVLAWPLAGLALHRWLENYAFRIQLSAGLFVAPGLGVLLLAFLTVSWQTWQAARTNPVTTLRSE